MHIISKIIILSIVLFTFTFGEEKKINLLYTANINATYTNCDCGSNPLGGIDRMKSFFDEFRLKNKNTIVIDGGNFFNSYSYIDLNNNALESLSFLKYDLLSPGMHIFLEEKDLFSQYSKRYVKQIVNSNCNLLFNKFQDLEVDKLKIRFYSYISPKLFKHSPKPEWLIINNKIDDIRYLDKGINVIIYCGFFEDAKMFLSANNKFDIALLSGDQQKGIWNTEKTVIIGGGHDAESVAVVEILLKNNKPEISMEYVDLDDSIKSDRGIIQLFENETRKEL